MENKLAEVKFLQENTESYFSYSHSIFRALIQRIRQRLFSNDMQVITSTGEVYYEKQPDLDHPNRIKYAKPPKTERNENEAFGILSNFRISLVSEVEKCLKNGRLPIRKFEQSLLDEIIDAAEKNLPPDDLAFLMYQIKNARKYKERVSQKLSYPIRAVYNEGYGSRNEAIVIKELLSKLSREYVQYLHDNQAKSSEYHQTGNQILTEEPTPILDDELKKSVAERRLTLHVFEHASLNEILDAIEKKQLVENIKIFEEIKKPLFRFVTNDDQNLSFKTSEVISLVFKEARTLAPEVAELGRQKNKENADEFAQRMYSIVNELQRECKISTYRETIKALNEKHIPTYRGGDWHLKTLQDLNKRWKELGLTSSPKPK